MEGFIGEYVAQAGYADHVLEALQDVSPVLCYTTGLFLEGIRQRDNDKQITWPLGDIDEALNWALNYYADRSALPVILPEDFQKYAVRNMGAVPIEILRHLQWQRQQGFSMEQAVFIPDDRLSPDSLIALVTIPSAVVPLWSDVVILGYPPPRSTIRPREILFAVSSGRFANDITDAYALVDVQNYDMVHLENFPPGARIRQINFGVGHTEHDKLLRRSSITGVPTFRVD